MSNLIDRTVVYNFIAGRLCLDFTNTVSAFWTSSPREYLKDYTHLVSWGRQAGLLKDEHVELLLAAADKKPDEAQATYRRAIWFRDALHRIFSAASRHQQAQAEDLAVLNKELSRARRYERITQEGKEFRLGWLEGGDALDRVLWPLARSAAELLTSNGLQRVSECAGETCGWLFYDTSRNHSRRWCDMKDCGNRAKARRHYHKPTGVG